MRPLLLRALASTNSTALASCHGFPAQPSDYAKTMYPKPTQLFIGKGVTDDLASESYWKASNGIGSLFQKRTESVLTRRQAKSSQSCVSMA